MSYLCRFYFPCFRNSWGRFDPQTKDGSLRNGRAWVAWLRLDFRILGPMSHGRSAYGF